MTSFKLIFKNNSGGKFNLQATVADNSTALKWVKTYKVFDTKYGAETRCKGFQRDSINMDDVIRVLGVKDETELTQQFLNKRHNELTEGTHDGDDILVNRHIHTAEWLLHRKQYCIIHIMWHKKLHYQLDESDDQNFSLENKWGQISLPYNHLGRHIWEMTQANDTDIGPKGFVRHQEYNNDFQIVFNEVTKEEADERLLRVKNFYSNNHEIFIQAGKPTFTESLRIGNIPLGYVEYKDRDDLLNILNEYNTFDTIEFI